MKYHPGKIFGIVLVIGGSFLFGHDLTIGAKPLSLIVECVIILLGLKTLFRK